MFKNMNLIKNAVLIYVCSIFLLINTSVKNMAKIVYPSFVNSATAGTIVGLMAPTARGPFFILTVLTSPLFNSIPLAIGLFNSIKTVKSECSTLNLQNAMQTMSINNLIDVLGIASICFLVSIFTYYTCFDIANALKKTCINLFKKFI